MKQFFTLYILLNALCLTVNADEPVTVEPLVKVSWGQYAPYNKFCPVVGSDNAAAGCVAVTMAQAISVINPSVVNVSDTSAVARLIADCGYAADTYYGKMSTATIDNQVHGLVDSLGYDPDMLIRYRDYMTYDEWRKHIYDELLDGRPVMMSAQDPHYGGHSFIIDGCRNDSVHVNWGWTGKENGYYSLDNLNPSIYHFTDNQRMITGFQCDDHRQTVNNALDAKCKLSETSLFESEVNEYKRVTLNVDIYNRSYYPFKGFYQIYFIDENGTMTKAKNGKDYVLSPLATERSTSAQIQLTPPTIAGTYRLYIKSSLLLDNLFSDMGLAGSTTLTILHDATDIEKPVIDVDDINNGQYYNVAGQRIAKPAGKRLFKRTRQGGQLVI